MTSTGTLEKTVSVVFSPQHLFISWGGLIKLWTISCSVVKYLQFHKSNVWYLRITVHMFTATFPLKENYIVFSPLCTMMKHYFESYFFCGFSLAFNNVCRMVNGLLRKMACIANCWFGSTEIDGCTLYNWGVTLLKKPPPLQGLKEISLAVLPLPELLHFLFI